MSNRPIQRLTASPVLVGALTTLIVIVAVFLAYNANNGLPFVPTYQVSVIVPDSNALVRNNDVRVGGVRIGTVQAVTPVQNADGSVDAKLDLKLDKSVDPLPVDSTFVVRSRSALGLKYLQITPGHSSEGLPQGGTLGIKAARPEPVEIDQLFNTFQRSTRRNIQRNQVEFGGAVAGRGPAINAALGVLRPLVDRLIPAMRNLSSPRTDLAGFLHGLENINGEIAPVAQTQADMFVALDQTFGALATVARPYIQDSITKGVATEQTTIDTLPRIRPFLVNSAGLFNDLEPGVRALAANAPALAQAFTVGAPILRSSPALNAQLPPTSEALLKFSRNPNVTNGLTGLTRTTKILKPTARLRRPGAVGLQLRDDPAEELRRGTQLRRWRRHLAAVDHDHAADPLRRHLPQRASRGPPRRQPTGRTSTTTSTTTPTRTPPRRARSPRECEAGNEPFLKGQTVIGNVPGNQGIKTSGQIPAAAEVSSMPRKPGTTKYNENFFRNWRGPGPSVIGAIVVVLVIIGIWLAFTKELPFQSPGYQLKATFANAVDISDKAPVRIAGVNVGQVTGLEREGNNSVVTFTVSDAGRPIHADASASIRPRIFLEGNFFIDLDPGSPSAPDLPDKATIPVTRTSTAVQLDQVLTALQKPERANLQRLLEGFGTALTYQPTPAEDQTQDPAVRGESAATALNQTFDYGAAAGRGSAIVNEALLGTRPDDLSQLLVGGNRIFKTLASREVQLKGLISNFNTFTGALAAQSGALSESIRAASPDTRHRRPLPGRPERGAAGAARLRDRRPAGDRRAAGDDQRRAAVAEAGKAAAQQARAGRDRLAARPRRPAAQRVDPGDPRPAAAADQVQPLRHPQPDPGRERRPQRHLRSRTTSAPASPTTASSSTRPPGSPARARTSTATAPTCASSPAAGRSP